MEEEFDDLLDDNIEEAVQETEKNSILGDIPEVTNVPATKVMEMTVSDYIGKEVMSRIPEESIEAFYEAQAKNFEILESVNKEVGNVIAGNANMKRLDELQKALKILQTANKNAKDLITQLEKTRNDNKKKSKFAGVAKWK